MRIVQKCYVFPKMKTQSVVRRGVKSTHPLIIWSSVTHTQSRYYIDEETRVQKDCVTFPRLCQSVLGRRFKPTQSFPTKDGVGKGEE